MRIDYGNDYCCKEKFNNLSSYPNNQTFGITRYPGDMCQDILNNISNLQQAIDSTNRRLMKMEATINSIESILKSLIENNKPLNNNE